MSLNYTAGDFESEHSYELTDDDGLLVFSDGPNPTEGNVHFIRNLSDCNDSDPDLNPEDFDGDGVSSCAGDCDDNDPSLSGADTDGDGYGTCPVDICYTLELIDSYGDGWNGGSLDVIVDGAATPYVFTELDGAPPQLLQNI
mgnify:CR=1 FL=1